MTDERRTFTDEEALAFHRYPTPGKIAIAATKPMATQRDLSLAYSPGVAVPVLAIAADPDLAYEYTSKGNLVAVITNGTAILGLGDLGPLAAKPVMEGKSVLFKRFADVDSIDIEVSSKDADEIITVVKNIGVTFGGINLEDIKSPECFRIETELQELLDIPVFHDDQHGTAIISAAGLINACHITGRDLAEVKVVLNGPGAAGIATLELIKAMGVRPENVIAVDSKGVLYRGRTEAMNQWKSAHTVETDKRTLTEALVGADVCIGLSVKGAITPEMVASMAPNPLIFAMANPDPEITPEEVHAVRPDAIVATGRSDYPNQVNNVLGFPYIFRGALDVRARRVNMEMKIACANALAQLAREDVPDEVAAAYHGRQLKFGPEYIIPTPFDPRLIWYIPPFVAQAAMDTGVARRPIEDMTAYRAQLAQRLDPTAAFLQKISGAVMSGPAKRIVFAEGEEPSVIRAAYAFQTQGLGNAVLVGREELIHDNMRLVGLDPAEVNLEIVNARMSDRNPDYVDHLYARVQREGFLKRDVQRLINQDRNSFAASMVALGDADGMVTGVTRSFDQSLEEVLRVIDPAPGGRVMGMSVVLTRGRTLFIADTNVTEMPEAQDIVEIACEAAGAVKRLGFTPRVAFMSYSTFGNPMGERSEKMRDAVAMLDEIGVDFEYEGEMPPELALEPERRANFPFMRLTGPANILIMPAIHSASISTKLVQSLGGATVIGPILLGMDRSVQIAPLSASVSKILNMAMMAAYDRPAEEAAGWGPMPLAEARDVRDRLKAWLLGAAYPLWREVGTDTAKGGFFEKIAQDGAPADIPRRLRVATRQTYSYALAASVGWQGPWRDTVEHGLAAMERYRRDDGLFAILVSPEGERLDDTPAPYEQAFVMLAFSAAQQALGRDFESRAVAVREALRARLGRPDGGFFDGVPHTGPLCANPHMHLFEAALAWIVAGEDPGWRPMAAGIADIALSQMIDPATGALCELFDTDWSPLPQADVEPGHQFEWGWLLIRFAALFDRPAARVAGLRLIGLAEAHGVDPVRRVVFNALDAALEPRDITARLWPQTERIKAAAAAALASGDDSFWTLAAEAGEGLLKYLDTPVAGLWRDRMEADGAFIDEPAPASSFYHIVGAIADLDQALAR